MKIVFVTTQSLIQSTLIGRVLPLAQEFQKMGNDVTVLVHSEKNSKQTTPQFPVKIQPIGPNPFERTSAGKKRKSGLALLWTMKMNALRAAWQLVGEKPDAIIIVKPLPENTFAVKLAKPFLGNVKIILDVDDFELEANSLTSLMQRAAIHWSERVASKIASHIIVATPFLGDHMQLLAGTGKTVTLIPTGLSYRGASEDGSAHAARQPHAILFAGSLSISSGHRVDMLPEILAQVRKSIPDATLILAGSGDDEGTVKKKFQAMGLEEAVDFRGRFSMERIESLVREASILIDPIDATIANRAKSSFRVALALVYGKPIVTSNIGIRTEMIPQKLHAAYFATPGDSSDYAEKIISLLQDTVSSEDKALLRDASKKYMYDRLAQTYYTCIV